MEAAPAADYAVRLRDRGMSAQDIADASRVAVTLVRRLLRPPGRRPQQIARTTAEAILGIPLPAVRDPVPLAGRGMVDAAPAAAQLAELAENGWPATVLATGLCVNPRTVAAVRDGRHQRISIAIDQRVRRLHAKLLPLDPVAAGVRRTDAARTRTRAQHRAAAAQRSGTVEPAAADTSKPATRSPASGPR